MTSINSSSSAMSPTDRMQLKLKAAVSAGTVKSTDQSALSSAITSINDSLQSAGAPTPGMDPSSIKDKVTSLIDDQVSSGTLTQDQAAELKQVFAQRSGGHHGHMEIPAGDAPSTSDNPMDALLSDLTDAIDKVLGTGATTSTANASVVASTSATPATSVADGSAIAGSDGTSTSKNKAQELTASIDQLVNFLKQVEQKLAGNYTATGSTTALITADPVLVDSNA